MSLIKKYSGEICYLELHNPEKRNALDKATITELTRFFEESAESTKFTVLIISGNGGIFSSGADLAWMKEGMNQTEEQNLEDARLFNKLYSTMYSYPKPVIVRVDKGAYGGALGILACSDIVCTSPDAEFAFSEVRLGLIPATVAPCVVRKIGISAARQLFLTARPFCGSEALSFGLVNFLFSEEQLAVKTRELAAEVAKNSPWALKETKLLLNRLGSYVVPIGEDLDEYCARIIAEARTSADGREGLSAFFEKRKPVWND